jgi:uncharacterized protein (DUF433 family)
VNLALGGSRGAWHHTSMNRDQIVTEDPETLGGTPVFSGTRVPVDSLLAHLKAGDTLDDFLDGFPSVSREQAEAFLDLALLSSDGEVPMRVLLDENVDRRLKRHFDAEFEVVTVSERGWSGTKRYVGMQNSSRR